MVLNYLRSPNFEPLAQVSLKYTTLKAVFLLALASGLRRSELHALLYSKDYCAIDEKGGMATLRFCPNFLPKNRKPTESNPPLYISGLLTDHILCPVRALRYYRKATAASAVRKSRQRQFVPYKDVNAGKEISPYKYRNIGGT